MTKAEALAWVEGVNERLRGKNPRSVALQERAEDVLAMEIVGTVDILCPVYVDSVEGSRVRDVDGNEYVDLTMGFGPHVIGHRPAAVQDAVADQLTRGWHWGVHNKLQLRLAELLLEAAPCGERVVFANSGTEATMYAVRAARAFTGRQVVGVFDGSYHGVHDYALMVADRSSERSSPRARRRGAGIPEQILDTVLMLPYNDEAAYDVIRVHAADLAAVIVEPVQSSNPQEDIGEWLRGLAQVCRQHGVLLVLDEVITGFRLAHGGGQEYFSVEADLATYGKALGGGLPVGAVAGRADVMSVFGRGTEAARPIFSGGTFSGNPLTMAAGIATLEHLRSRPGGYAELNEKGNRLARVVNEHAVAEGLPVKMMNAGSMFHLHFVDEEVRSSRDLTGDHARAEQLFYQLLQERGVLVPGIHLAFVSMAHGDDEVDMVAEAVKDSLDDLRRAELI